MHVSARLWFKFLEQNFLDGAGRQEIIIIIIVARKNNTFPDTWHDTRTGKPEIPEGLYRKRRNHLFNAAIFYVPGCSYFYVNSLVIYLTVLIIMQNARFFQENFNLIDTWSSQWIVAITIKELGSFQYFFFAAVHLGFHWKSGFLFHWVKCYYGRPVADGPVGRFQPDHFPL